MIKRNENWPSKHTLGRSEEHMQARLLIIFFFKKNLGHRQRAYMHLKLRFSILKVNKTQPFRAAYLVCCGKAEAVEHKCPSPVVVISQSESWFGSEFELALNTSEFTSKSISAMQPAIYTIKIRFFEVCSYKTLKFRENVLRGADHCRGASECHDGTTIQFKSLLCRLERLCHWKSVTGNGD